MDELLKKLLAAEILTEETKTELESAIKKQLEETTAAARADAQASVTAELNEQWITERDTLIEALDAKVTEALTEELNVLRKDIENFRDLEAEYAEKIVEAKGEMAATLKSDVAQLIEKLDAFLEVRLSSEIDELREDIAVVRKNEFGRKVFESFIEEFRNHYTDDGSVEAKLNESQQQLDDAIVALEASEKKAATLERSIKLEKTLAPLSGQPKEVMEAILKNVPTTMLEDAYSTYIGRVLKETSVAEVKQTSEKETKVLAEDSGKPKKAVVEGVIKTGTDEQRLVEEAAIREAEASGRSTQLTDAIAHMRKVAGLA